MDSRGLTLAVIDAIAYADGKSPEDIDYNLYEYVDLDVLFILVDGVSTTWEFSFELPNHTVKVTSDGLIFVDGVRFEVDGSVVTEGRTWTEEYR